MSVGTAQGDLTPGTAETDEVDRLGSVRRVESRLCLGVVYTCTFSEEAPSLHRSSTVSDTPGS